MNANPSMSKSQIEQIAKALADPNRLDILQAVNQHGELSCGELVAMSRLSQPTISHHIKILVESGLLASEKEGRCLRLRINHECMSHFQSCLQHMLNQSPA